MSMLQDTKDMYVSLYMLSTRGWLKYHCSFSIMPKFWNFAELAKVALPNEVLQRNLQGYLVVQLTNAFISCRLNYFNSVPYGLPSTPVPIYCTQCHIDSFSYITPVLREPHGLSYLDIISFKICLSISLCLHGLAQNCPSTCAILLVLYIHQYTTSLNVLAMLMHA